MLVTWLKRKPWVLLASITIGWVILLTSMSLVYKRHAIETDLLQRTRKTFTEFNLPSSVITLVGRDLTLRGTIETEQIKTAMLTRAARVKGVRVVHDELTIAAHTDAAQTKRHTEALFNNGRYIPQRNHPIEKRDLSAIQFDYAKSELNEAAQLALEPVIQALQAEPALIIEVSAHTEAKGSALGNMTVTQARADAIRQHLINQGIQPERIFANGYGAMRPLTLSDDPLEAATNRRIEIHPLAKP